MIIVIIYEFSHLLFCKKGKEKTVKKIAIFYYFAN